MRLIKLYVLLFSLVIQSTTQALATPRLKISAAEKCMYLSTNLTVDCMKRHLLPKTLTSCYKLSETIYSNHSKENVKNYCFYNISEFPTLNSCVDSAKKFYLGENQDQALFECVRQFTSTITMNQCLKVSRMMIYKDKSNYLARHCGNL